MIDATEFAKNFPNAVVPDALQKLLDFGNNTSGPNFYAAGFELIVNEAPGMLESYSSDPSFLNALRVFAQASAGGSLYALWRTADTDWDAAPIIAFGDEGGFVVIAQNIRELLQLLTLDTEPRIGWDGVGMNRQEGDPVSPASERYKTWLKTNFNLDAIAAAEPLIAAAQAKHQTAFGQWMSTYYSQ